MVDEEMGDEFSFLSYSLLYLANDLERMLFDMLKSKKADWGENFNS